MSNEFGTHLVLDFSATVNSTSDKELSNYFTTGLLHNHSKLNHPPITLHPSSSLISITSTLHEQISIALSARHVEPELRQLTPSVQAGRKSKEQPLVATKGRTGGPETTTQHSKVFSFC